MIRKYEHKHAKDLEEIQNVLKYYMKARFGLDENYIRIFNEISYTNAWYLQYEGQYNRYYESRWTLNSRLYLNKLIFLLKNNSLNDYTFTYHNKLGSQIDLIPNSLLILMSDYNKSPDTWNSKKNTNRNLY